MTEFVKPLTNHCLSSQPTFQAAFTDGEPPHRELNILTLNEDVFQAILSHLSYDEVAKLRLVLILLYERKMYVTIIFSVLQRFANNSIMIAKSGSTKGLLLSKGTTASA